MPWLSLALLLLAASAVAAAPAETVYVSDLLRVGVRAEANSTDSPVTIVTSGESLEVIQRGDGYVKVRTDEGLTGWVSNVYVTAEPPARLRVERLQAEYATLQRELAQLRATSGDAFDENARLRRELGELRAETGGLHGKISHLYAEVNQERQSAGWFYAMLAMIALFIGGIVLGVLWHRQQVSARFGGLRL